MAIALYIYPMPTEPTEPLHRPLQRIREALSRLPEESDAHRMSKVKDFSRWVGCSESLIRNVEAELVKVSPKLARAIESKTGVSSAWILGDSDPAPDPSGPIIDRQGRPWRAESLDLFCYLPNLERLLVASPTLLPGIVARMVEAQMNLELHEGEDQTRTLTAILGLLQRRDFFEEDGKGASRHPLDWLPGDDGREGQAKLGLELLLDKSATLKPEQSRALDYLRVSEPPPPPDSRLIELHCGRIQKRRKKRFSDSRYSAE